MSSTPLYKPGNLQFPSLTIDTAGQMAKRMKASSASVATQTLNTDQAGYIQRVEARRKSGRKLSRKARSLKVLASNLGSMVTRFQYLDPMNDSDGLPFKLNYELTSTEDAKNVYPFYLFDLTSVPNRVSYAPNQWHFPNVCYRLRRLRNLISVPSEYNQRFDWSPGLDTAGILADGLQACHTWQLEKRSSYINSISHGHAHLDWIDIGIGMIGAKRQPVNAHVFICQFDEKYCPGYFGKVINPDTAVATDFKDIGERLESDGGNDKDGVTVPSDEVRNWNEFYTGLVDKFISHPMNKRDAYNVKGMKVLAHQKLVFNPTAQYETDPRGHKKQFKWFNNINRLTNFQWENTTDQLPIPTPPAYGVYVTNEVTPNVWDTVNANMSVQARTDSNQCAPHKNARVFMLVCAESPANGAFSTDDHASFEVIIRRKHSTFN